MANYEGYVTVDYECAHHQDQNITFMNIVTWMHMLSYVDEPTPFGRILHWYVPITHKAYCDKYQTPPFTTGGGCHGNRGPPVLEGRRKSRACLFCDWTTVANHVWKVFAGGCFLH